MNIEEEHERIYINFILYLRFWHFLWILRYDAYCRNKIILNRCPLTSIVVLATIEKVSREELQICPICYLNHTKQIEKYSTTHNLSFEFLQFSKGTKQFKPYLQH